MSSSIFQKPIKETPIIFIDTEGLHVLFRQWRHLESEIKQCIKDKLISIDEISDPSNRLLDHDPEDPKARHWHKRILDSIEIQIGIIIQRNKEREHYLIKESIRSRSDIKLKITQPLKNLIKPYKDHSPVLAAYSIEADINYIRHFTGLKLNYPSMCICRLAKLRYSNSGLRSFSLKNVADYLGMPMGTTRWHQADYDVMITAELFCRDMWKYKDITFYDLDQNINKAIFYPNYYPRRPTLTSIPPLNANTCPYINDQYPLISNNIYYYYAYHAGLIK